MPNAPSGDATRPRQGLQRHFTDAHTTLDAIEPRLPQLPPRVGIRYALVRGRVYNSSGELERGPDALSGGVGAGAGRWRRCASGGCGAHARHRRVGRRVIDVESACAGSGAVFI